MDLYTFANNNHFVRLLNFVIFAIKIYYFTFYNNNVVYDLLFHLINVLTKTYFNHCFSVRQLIPNRVNDFFDKLFPNF